jgi:hypothetical protein
MMEINSLLEALEYSGRHWVTPDSADPRLVHHYRLAQKAGTEAGADAEVLGSYVYQTSLDDKLLPPRPAVFVARAGNEEQAREIHKRLWNLGECPFVLIVLPDVVRVYTGFNYSADDQKSTIVVDELADALRHFNAESIDTGRIWKEQAKYLGSDKRVDYRLLSNLKELSTLLKVQHGLSSAVAHALIGKYIYFCYLRDRGILGDEWLGEHDIRAQDVFGREATAQGFGRLAQALQTQFNGDIFPLPVDDDGSWREGDAVPTLARIFHGDSTDGQLALDFGVYDFSFIPVELLSSIYEQFLKEEGGGEDDGVVYTPEALADYVLAELEAVHPLELTHKVLDPCCGSGIFLVLAYRRLIERLWSEQNQRPSAQAMKQLLQENIFGIEKDREACDITAFSLLLTLMSHLEPPELQKNTEQFPALVGTNIFHSDFFDDACPIFQKEMRFDWVLGNPPWTSANEKNPDHQRALDWMREAAKVKREVGRRRLDEAFTWRAGDVLQPKGHAALLIMATSLFNSSSSDYRKGFFAAFHAKRVTNLSNFLRILFTGPQGKRAEAPATCLVYGKFLQQNQRESILHFGPFVANQAPLSTKGRNRNAWTITLYEGDIQQIDYQDAVDDAPCLWKTALWGGYQDRRALSRLKHILPRTLGEVADERGWLLCKGTDTKSLNSTSAAHLISVPELKNQRILETEHLTTRFALSEDALRVLGPENWFARKQDGFKSVGLIAAPHVVLTAEVAIYSDLDFVIPTPKIGIAAEHDGEYLKATTLYLNSSVARYAHFFHSALWGISIGTINQENVRTIPFTNLTTQHIKKLTATYDELAKREQDHLARHAPLQGPALDLQDEVDAAVAQALGIPDDISSVARDFFQVRYQLIKGKTGDSASKPPTKTQLEEYAEQLRLQVDDFARRHHCITIRAGREAIIATVEVTLEQSTLPVTVCDDLSSAGRDIMRQVREQHSQWAYVQRSVRIYDGPRVHIIKSARLLDWTRTQAIQDAGELIADVLEKTEPRHEPVAA